MEVKPPLRQSGQITSVPTGADGFIPPQSVSTPAERRTDPLANASLPTRQEGVVRPFIAVTPPEPQGGGLSLRKPETPAGVPGQRPTHPLRPPAVVPAVATNAVINGLRGFLAAIVHALSAALHWLTAILPAALPGIGPLLIGFLAAMALTAGLSRRASTKQPCAPDRFRPPALVKPPAEEPPARRRDRTPAQEEPMPTQRPRPATCQSAA